MIKINSRKDERISQCFPNDPYSNLCIVTTTQKLFLQHAFLSMDSGYFARIDPDAREVDLRELHEQPLVRVLHSLYGEELSVNSVAELADLLPIILYLEIQQYRRNIERDILEKQELLQNVEIIELAFRYQLLWKEVVQLHVQMDLSMLESSRSFLQIGKLSNDTFNALLRQYIERTGGKNAKVLNQVMENYFNKKGIKPIPYLQTYNFPLLLRVWMDYHHTFEALTPTQEMTTSRTLEGNSPEVSLTEKINRVSQIESEIRAKDETISKLIKSIEQLKSQLGIRQKLATAKSLFIVTEPETTTSIQQETLDRRSRLSPQFKSCIYTETKHEKRSSSSKWKTYNRFGSKNAKRWA